MVTQLYELEEEMLDKRKHFEEIADRLQHQSFIHPKEVKNIEMNVQKAKVKVETVTEMVKILEKFIFKETDWQDTLSKNNRLGRRLLMAIKEHSRPDQ